MLQEDGWVVCRVFKKKCFFKIGGGGEGSTSQGADAGGHLAVSPPLSGHHQGALASHYMHPHQYYHAASSYYSQMQQVPGPYSHHHVQVQDLLTNHRPTPDAGYDFSGLPVEHPAAAGLDVGSSDGGVATDGGGGQMGEAGTDQPAEQQWQAIDGFSNGPSSAAVQQMTGAQRGGEMDLWGYGR